MSREKQIERLRDMIHDELENLRCAAQGGRLPDNAWDRVDALTAGLLALKGQESDWKSPRAEPKAELLRALCKAVASHQKPWDVGIMDQLLAAWDAGAKIADPLTVALLAPKLEWAKQCLARDPYLTDEVYAKLLLAVIPAVCPELREQEEGEINDENA